MRCRSRSDLQGFDRMSLFDRWMLDCGCGHAMKGTVNVDLHPEETEHRGEGGRINPHGKLFVKADIHHLPFPSHFFNIAVANHLLEHLEDPEVAIAEMIRVAREIRISVPHRFTIRSGYRQKSHKHKFNERWFSLVFKQQGIRMLSHSTRFGLFGVPEEISVIGEREMS